MPTAKPDEKYSNDWLHGGDGSRIRIHDLYYAEHLEKWVAVFWYGTIELDPDTEYEWELA